MNILALDTAGAVLSAALSVGEETWYAEVDGGMRHSELLMDLADQLLRNGGLKPAGLEGVLCMGGPGSFTGLRIGFAAAKGLALSRGIPWASVPTLDCMAFPHSAWPGAVLPVIDAKKRSFFAALYRGGNLVSPYLDAGPAEIAGLLRSAGGPGPALLAGPDGELLMERFRESLSGESFSPLRVDPLGKKGRARELLEIGKLRQLLKTSLAGFYEGPLYLRKSDAEINRECPAPPLHGR